jgi:hypothetical protein
MVVFFLLLVQELMEDLGVLVEVEHIRVDLEDQELVLLVEQ